MLQKGVGCSTSSRNRGSAVSTPVPMSAATADRPHRFRHCAIFVTAGRSRRIVGSRRRIHSTTDAARVAKSCAPTFASAAGRLAFASLDKTHASAATMETAVVSRVRIVLRSGLLDMAHIPIGSTI